MATSEQAPRDERKRVRPEDVQFVSVTSFVLVLVLTVIGLLTLWSYTSQLDRRLQEMRAESATASKNASEDRARAAELKSKLIELSTALAVLEATTGGDWHEQLTRVRERLAAVEAIVVCGPHPPPAEIQLRR